MNIFVTVGSKDYPFDRLINAVDKKGVVMQIGLSTPPKQAKYFRFLNKQEMYDWYSWADVIVCHCGTGTITEAIDFNKKIVLVPRLAKLKEHIDDHQSSFAEFASKKFSLTPVYNVSKLWEEIKISKKAKNSLPSPKLISAVKKALFD